MVYAGQDTHLVDRIFFVLIGLGTDFHLFEGVDLIILYSSDFVNTRIGAIAKLLQNHEVSELRILFVLHFVGLAEAGMTGSALSLNWCLKPATDRRYI